MKRYDFHSNQGTPFMREVPNGKWMLAEDVIPMSDWIDIRQALPKANKYVIFALTAESAKKWGQNTVEGFYEPWLNGMQFWRASRAPSAVQSFKDVTHWMEPQPPKI